MLVFRFTISFNRLLKTAFFPALHQVSSRAGVEPAEGRSCAVWDGADFRATLLFLPAIFHTNCFARC